MCLCPRAYPRNCTFDRHHVLPVAMARSGGVAMRYVGLLPVLQMTSYLHIICHYRCMTIPLQRVTLLRRRAQTNAPAMSYCLESKSTRRHAPRPDESVQGAAKRAMHHIAFRGFVANRLINRWNQLDQRVVDASRINAFKGWMNKTRETRMGFFVD